MPNVFLYNFLLIFFDLNFLKNAINQKEFYQRLVRLL